MGHSLLNVKLFPVWCVAPHKQPSTFAKMKCVKPQSRAPRSSFTPSFTHGCPSQQTYQVTPSSIIVLYNNVYKLVNNNYNEKESLDLYLRFVLNSLFYAGSMKRCYSFAKYPEFDLDLQYYVHNEF